MEKLTFQGKDGEQAEFYVLEQTRVNGVNYLLVADSEEDDGECLILKDMASEEEQESLYEIVEDEQELSAVLTVFEQLLDDVEIER
ncbi:DUF1292 domain-containing protein [Clostridiaceae bacterium Marseille-Q4145]|mgnify:FL=1|nr:DUF1292 domain-containing protein [Clostridiaceae bacterium Marseille-Q4145]